MNKLNSDQFEYTEITLDNIADLQSFYSLYQSSFPHIDEREPIEAFEQILGFNRNEELQNRFGPYKEIIIAIRQRDTHKIVGGLVLGVTTSQDHIDAGFVASIQAIYYFLDKGYRKGVASLPILRLMRKWAVKVIPLNSEFTENDIAIFFEVNDPRRMSIEDIDQDFDNSGLDPYRRYRAYLHFSKPLDFEYIQPPLDSSKEAVNFLDLFCVHDVIKGGSVPTKMLLKHLYNFFSFSVLKGKDAYLDESFKKMEIQLLKEENVKFVSSEAIKIADIVKQAQDRAKLERQLENQRGIHFPLPKTSPVLLFWKPKKLFTRIWNWFYEFIYKAHHKLAQHHIKVAYIELGVGLIGIFFFVMNRTIISSWLHSVGWLEHCKLLAEELEEKIHIPVIIFLFFYLASRALVQIRRSRIGYPLNNIWKKWRQIYDPSANNCEQTFVWLHDNLKQRVINITEFGSFKQAEISEQERSNIRFLIANYSAQIYSEKVWGVVDFPRRDWELEHLTKWLNEFPDGLMAANFNNCPNLSFFSVILPIRLQSKLSRVDLETIEIDKSFASNFNNNSNLPICLLIQRHVVCGENNKKVPKIEMELCLILTILLHLRTLLKMVAKNEDLHGLPNDINILWLSAHPHGNRLLQEWLGFTLLQRSEPHEGLDIENKNVGQSNLNVYSTSLSSFTGQRLLSFVSELKNI